MERAAILFFSGTGNSKWVARGIQERMIEQEASATLFSVEEMGAWNFASFDAIVLVHPIYGANIPKIVKTAFPAIRLAKGARVSVVATFGFVNALGPFKEARELGLRLHSHFNVRMFNNVSTPRLKAPIMGLARRLGKKTGRERKVIEVADAILSGKRKFEGIGPYLIAGKVIKRLSWKRLEENYKAFSVDLPRCVSCMKCVSECPTGAISRTGNGGFEFSPACTACMRCYNRCPAAAIMVDGVYADPEIFPRYGGPWGKGKGCAERPRIARLPPL